MRDATHSWAGYLYQSIIGLIVVMEKILDFQSRKEDIIGVLVYEDFEDFSIYLKDQAGQIFSSMTYQVKFKKSTVPSDYYPFFKDLVKRQESNQKLEHFLNISSNIDFSKVDIKRNALPVNFQNILHTYRNGNNYLGGLESLSYLEDLVKEIVDNLGLDYTQSRIERVVSIFIATIDKVIIRTKDIRQLKAEYTEIIQIQSFIDIIQNLPNDLTNELVAKVIRKRILNAFYMYSESLEDNDVVELERFVTYISSIKDNELINFAQKIEIHKNLNGLIELISTFSNPEDIQDILLEVIKSTNITFDKERIIFEKNNCAYRPSTMRMSRNEGTAQQNLKMKYIPQIQRNMSLYDVEGYFQTKKIIISGETVENIWEYNITSSHSPKKENRINEPELKTLINVTEAIEELNADD